MSKTTRPQDVPDELLDILAEFERFTVNRARLTVQQTVNACFVPAARAALYEEFRDRIERRARGQLTAEQTRARKIVELLEREIAAGNRIAVVEPDGRVVRIEITPGIARGES